MRSASHREYYRSETPQAGMDCQFQIPFLLVSGLQAAPLLTAIVSAVELSVPRSLLVQSSRSVSETGREI